MAKNPLWREPTANPPVSRTHCREPTRTHLESGFGKVGSSPNPLGAEWVRSTWPSSPQPQAVASPGCSQRATGREPTANPLGQKREPTSRTHFSRTHFPRTHANPLRTHLFREPTSRTHANPMRNTMVFPMRTHLQVGSRKVGSNRSGFEEKWVRVETIPNPLGKWVRSGFDPPSCCGRARGARSRTRRRGGRTITTPRTRSVWCGT
jgi:hypothetical protein